MMWQRELSLAELTMGDYTSMMYKVTFLIHLHALWALFSAWVIRQFAHIILCHVLQAIGSSGGDLQLVFPLFFFLWLIYLPLFRTVRHCYQADKPRAPGSTGCLLVGTLLSLGGPTRVRVT